MWSTLRASRTFLVTKLHVQMRTTAGMQNKLESHGPQSNKKACISPSLRVKLLSDKATPPKRGSLGAAGYDLARYGALLPLSCSMWYQTTCKRRAIIEHVPVHRLSRRDWPLPSRPRTWFCGACCPRALLVVHGPANVQLCICAVYLPVASAWHQLLCLD
jgi:hypothetical protein